jgi:hypothetical protein
MATFTAGFLGIGTSEVTFLLILAAAMFVITRKRRRLMSRACPACGRGLTQATDTTFCGYCGHHLS